MRWLVSQRNLHWLRRPAQVEDLAWRYCMHFRFEVPLRTRREQIALQVHRTPTVGRSTTCLQCCLRVRGARGTTRLHASPTRTCPTLVCGGRAGPWLWAAAVHSIEVFLRCRPFVGKFDWGMQNIIVFISVCFPSVMDDRALCKRCDSRPLILWTEYRFMARVHTHTHTHTHVVFV
jgi:hypothetical protein